MTPAELKHALERPFPESKISWRVGSTNADKSKGLALAYVDARDVMQRLDEACGFGGWQCKYSMASADLLICDIGILFTETVGGVIVARDWLWRANGAGATDVEAEKGKASDAFKRAAVLWGVGRYLYSLPSPWVELEPVGRSYKIKNQPKMPAWATPEGYDAIIAGRTPNTGAQVCKDALDEMGEEERAFIEQQVIEIRKGLSTVGGPDTMQWIERQLFTVEENLAIWSLLDSRERSSLKGKRKEKTDGV